MADEQIPREARYRVDDEGIIHGREVPGTAFELSDATEAMTLIRKLANGHKMALLMDITNLKSMSRDARAYFAQPAHTEVLHAVALLTGSLLSRAIGNFFLGLNKPAAPTRLFTDEASALAWLRSFLGSNDGRA
jgi:hypothetical protein